MWGISCVSSPAFCTLKFMIQISHLSMSKLLLMLQDRSCDLVRLVFIKLHVGQSIITDQLLFCSCNFQVIKDCNQICLCYCIMWKQVSNTFHFTFTVRPEAKAMKNGFKLRNVVPATEEEARRILERIDADNLNEFFRT